VKRRFIKLAVSLAISSLLLACGKKQEAEVPKPDPTPLFKPAVSYWNFDKAQREFKLKNWDTLEDRKPLVSDKRPPFRMLIIRVPSYQDHGFTGDLVLTFYNDRLMKTQYYVPKIKEYVTAAGGDQQVSLGNDLSGAIAPHTHVWIGKEADGRTYLGMEDEILKQQMDDWILRYSQAG
jgi:hypothetical protein